MSELRKYGAGSTVYFPLIDFGATDFESTPVTFASGDTEISKDGGAFANTNSNPAHEGNGIYSLVLTATEMQAAEIVITVIDQTATKLWEDQAIIISTYGNASAQHAFDLDVAEQTVDAVKISGSSTAADNVEANIGNLDATVSSRSSHSAADVWTSGTRVLTANTNLNDPTAATTADAVLDELLSGHTTAGSLGKAVGDLDTNVDTTVSSRSSHSAADVWTVVTRTLTANTNFNDPTAAVIADAVLDELLSGHVTAGSLGKAVADILVDTGTDGVAIATATMQAIADEALKRGMSNVEDAADALSLCALVLATFESSISGTTWTVRKSGGATFATRTVTLDAGADPITGVT